MSRRTRRGWISMVVVALVAAAGAFTGPILRAQAPTRLLADIDIPARPTTLQRDVITLRETYHLPALELCVINAKGIVDVAASGVRKVGGTAAVTSKNLFH